MLRKRSTEIGSEWWKSFATPLLRTPTGCNRNTFLSSHPTRYNIARDEDDNEGSIECPDVVPSIVLKHMCLSRDKTVASPAIHWTSGECRATHSTSFTKLHTPRTRLALSLSSFRSGTLHGIFLPLPPSQHNTRTTKSRYTSYTSFASAYWISLCYLALLCFALLDILAIARHIELTLIECSASEIGHHLCDW